MKHLPYFSDVIKNFNFISSKIAPFIRSMINSGEYDVVIDVHQLRPSDFLTYITNEKTDILLLRLIVIPIFILMRII